MNTDEITRNVSALTSGGRGGRRTGRGRGRGGRGGGRNGRGNPGRGNHDNSKNERWCKYKEWIALDADTKQKVIQAREKRNVSETETFDDTKHDPSGGTTQRTPTKKQKMA